jgi:hypothetical protein
MVLLITRKQNDFVHVAKLDRGWSLHKILSIEQYGFFGEGRHCEPVNMRLTTDTAPPGTAYIATVTARCQPDGSVTAGKLQTFEFNRYKGNLTVTTK